MSFNRCHQLPSSPFLQFQAEFFRERLSTGLTDSLWRQQSLNPHPLCLSTTHRQITTILSRPRPVLLLAVLTRHMTGPRLERHERERRMIMECAFRHPNPYIEEPDPRRRPPASNHSSPSNFPPYQYHSLNGRTPASRGSPHSPPSTRASASLVMSPGNVSVLSEASVVRHMMRVLHKSIEANVV